MINFLTEIADSFPTTIHPTPSNIHDKRFNIYELDISDYPKNSYWLDWGGYYDNFTGTQIDIYYGDYLDRVNTLNQLLVTTPTPPMRGLMFVSGRTVYINIIKHPWLYPDYSTSVENVIPFLSSALNPDSPSNNIIREVNAQTRLEIPSFNVKLSDSINGITLNQGFSISLYNNDGYFDNEKLWNLFNTPLYVKKSIKENPQYNDFRIIRSGLIENVNTSFDKIQINVSDKFKSLEEPICNVIKRENFNTITLNDDCINKPIPIIYGQKIIKLTKLNDNTYLTAENATSVIRVFGKDGNPLLSNPVLSSNKTITTSMEADEALVTGNANNRIGQIIQDIMISKANITYNNTNFNTTEINSYSASSAQINIAINNGNVKNAIETVLKNDVAFFIQQTDGRFTIRKYGNDYLPIRNIPSWSITQKPEKNYNNAHNNYFSSCIINYNVFNYNIINNNMEVERSYLFNEKENEAEKKYKRKVQKVFDTDLINENDCRQLAVLLSNRYTNMRQSIRLPIGIDTSQFQLLDTVNIDLTINERKFSNVAKYIIKEINYSQDILNLEEV